MTLRCKPGCLARLTKSFYPENIGLIVEVKTFVGDHEVIWPDGSISELKDCWVVLAPAHTKRSPVPHADMLWYQRHGDNGMASDDALVPINDPDLDLSTETDEGLDVSLTRPACEQESTPA